MMKKNNNNYKNFLREIIQEIILKSDNHVFDDSPNERMGYDFAIYEIISLLVQQSELDGIDKEEIGLQNINPERDFLFKNKT